MTPPTPRARPRPRARNGRPAAAEQSRSGREAATAAVVTRPRSGRGAGRLLQGVSIAETWPTILWNITERARTERKVRNNINKTHHKGRIRQTPTSKNNNNNKTAQQTHSTPQRTAKKQQYPIPNTARTTNIQLKCCYYIKHDSRPRARENKFNLVWFYCR